MVLVSTIGAVAALDWLRSESLQPPGLTEHPGWRSAASRWRPRLRDLDPRRELETMHRRGGTVLLPGRPALASQLGTLGDAAPLCLYLLGPADLATLTARSVAVVGARASTDYGRAVTRDLGAGLVSRGVTVISGGAYGIDAEAHRSAVVDGGPSVAVMAGGLDRADPAGNTELLLRVVECGALVSEAPPGTSPMRQRFLARNRLIAALTQATVVVEAAGGPQPQHGAACCGAAAAGGSRAGAGDVDGIRRVSSAAAGGHRGVCDRRRGGARVGAAAGHQVPEPTVIAGLLDGLGHDERRVLDALPARSAAEVDNLVRVCGLGVRETLAALGMLEMAGRVERLGSGWRRAV